MKKRPFTIALVVIFTIFAFFSAVIFLLDPFGGSGQQFALGEKVGVIEISGTITDSKSVIDDLLEFSKNKSIKAIVLRVDSPGGGVGPSQEIHAEVVRIKEIKPVIVSMGSVAASGGYYVAAPADKIFANPGTITGSIGVIMEFTNVVALMDKVGLKTSVVKSGIHKDIGSAVRTMTVEERELLQGLIDDVHSQFVAAVSSGRDIDEIKVREFADGRIFTGRQAQQLGLVDELGGLQAAIREAGRMAEIQGTPKVVYPEEPRVNLIDYFIGQTISKVEQSIQGTNKQGLQLLWSQAI
ncbi:MAG: signal peptide peptidase SppA [Desulfuromonas sp.]|nr:signal peptide peptidase SppA [Desulfuromonas sp.]